CSNVSRARARRRRPLRGSKKYMPAAPAAALSVERIASMGLAPPRGGGGQRAGRVTTRPQGWGTPLARSDMDETDRPHEAPPSPQRSRAFWIAAALLGAVLVWLWAWGDRAMTRTAAGRTLDYSAFYSFVEQGKVDRVTIRGHEIQG